MSTSLSIKHLIFISQDSSVKNAILKFERGLNVIYGASETGKSFTLEAIDYMLGGKELRDIPERVGYHSVLLAMETSTGDSFTLVRSIDGGQFKVFDGLHETLPDESVKNTILISKHSAENPNNISTYLLNKIGLADKKLKKNVNYVTKNLSMRHLSHLCLITEEDIQKQSSPIEKGVTTEKTAEYAVFKLLLTGVDDSALISTSSKEAISQLKAGKLEVIDELLKEYNKMLSEENININELRKQQDTLEDKVFSEQDILKFTENFYQSLVEKRSHLRKKLQNGSERRVEIEELKARFLLLDEHYLSDLARLEGIREAGSLIYLLEKTLCPMCGASPKHQHLKEDCQDNLEPVVIAADAESAKIIKLRRELALTLEQLIKEASNFDLLLPPIHDELLAIETQIKKIEPDLSEQRANYGELLEKRSQVRDELRILEQINDLIKRRSLVENNNGAEKSIAQANSDLSSTTLDQFALNVESLLKAWNFPDSKRVYFDEKTKDLIISGKKRGSRGKGMRSIIHAAFTIALMQFCKENNQSHPGFVVLDSPLLAYREPESQEDDLSDTDVQEKFYEYLTKISDRQIIIMENINPPTNICELSSSVQFTKNPHQGRYGLFPPFIR